MKISCQRFLCLLSLTLVFLANTVMASPVTDSLAGKLVSVQGKTVKKFDDSALSTSKYTAVYFSASWCGPCRKFTPELVSWYQANKAKYPQFELVFVSRDETENAMEEYMKNDAMPWPALAFRKLESTTEITKYAGRGIPCLVMLDENGKVLSHSYEGEVYVGPYKVLKDIERILGENPAPAASSSPATGAASTSKVGTGKFDIFANKK